MEADNSPDIHTLEYLRNLQERIIIVLHHLQNINLYFYILNDIVLEN